MDNKLNIPDTVLRAIGKSEMEQMARIISGDKISKAPFEAIPEDEIE